VRKSEWSSEVK